MKQLVDRRILVKFRRMFVRMNVREKVEVAFIAMLGILGLLAFCAIAAVAYSQFSNTVLQERRLEPMLKMQQIVDDYRELLDTSNKVRSDVMPSDSALSMLKALEVRIDRNWGLLKTHEVEDDIRPIIAELKRNKSHADAAKAKLRSLLEHHEGDELEYFISSDLQLGIDPMLVTSQRFIDAMRQKAGSQLLTLDRIYTTMYAIAACLLLIAAIIVHSSVRYMNRHVLTPLASLAHYANPDHRDSVNVKHLGLRRRDEIGAISRAIQRSHTQSRRALTAQRASQSTQLELQRVQIDLQRERSARAHELAQIVQDYEARLSKLAGELASASETMNATAHEMMCDASQTERCSIFVASNADQTVLSPQAFIICVASSEPCRTKHRKHS